MTQKISTHLSACERGALTPLLAGYDADASRIPPGIFTSPILPSTFLEAGLSAPRGMDIVTATRGTDSPASNESPKPLQPRGHIGAEPIEVRESEFFNRKAVVMHERREVHRPGDGCGVVGGV